MPDSSADAKSKDQLAREVIAAELAQIAARRQARNLEEKLADAPSPDTAYEQAGKQEIVGLAFSGGGIRSATFNLGILQGLAKLGLLKYVDYLSTVSGGGYIGSWLAAWIKRKGMVEVERDLHPERLKQSEATDGAKPKAPPAEPAPIFHLRRFSNYLSPKLGLMSADMWVLFATYIRNLLICQLVLLPATVAVLLLSRLFMVLYHTQTPAYAIHSAATLWERFIGGDAHQCEDALGQYDQWLLGGVIVVFWFVAALVAFVGSGRVRPENATGNERPGFRFDQTTMIWVVVLLGITSFLFCWLPTLRQYATEATDAGHSNVFVLGIKYWKLPEETDTGWDADARRFLAMHESTPKVVAAFLFTPAVVVMIAYLLSIGAHRQRRWWIIVRHLIGTAFACAIGGVLLYCVWLLLIWLCKAGPLELADYVQARAAARVTTFGPPMVLGVMVVTIFLGIAIMGDSLEEGLREWWSRLCAWIMIFGAVWMLINMASIYATAAILWAGTWMQAGLVSGWITTVLAGVFAGGSATTGHTGDGAAKNPRLELLARLAPALFVVGIIIGVSLGLHFVLDNPPNWGHVLDSGNLLRRDVQEHPPIRITENIVRDGDRPGKKRFGPDGRKETIERSRVIDESVLTSHAYWTGIFNTDAKNIPNLVYGLRDEDITYLEKERGLKPKTADKFREIRRKAVPVATLAEFRRIYADAFEMLATDNQIGGPTKPEIDELAEDWTLIKFHPGLLFWKYFSAFLGCIVLFCVAAKFADVNRFSLHSLYGNRLVRCYLGASHAEREQTADPFTGFDSGDDLKLATLIPGMRGQGTEDAYDGPYLIVNTALNLVSGTEMAWQERMAESFIMTPLKCGCPNTGYCDTSVYAANLPLGEAMTISGAAASPNSGYHSSPAVTALLTVFNARLGAWLGNPKVEATRGDTSPKSGFLYLRKELFGLTTDTSDYVYLSDGGHFENLGVYELVRRRCRFIIVSDAGCDPEHIFEDVGNLIRKVWADFGIRIEIDLEALRLAATGRTRWHCGVGRIRYDDVEFGAVPGTLVYLKPSLTGDESADILHYKSQNPTFPHETTGDQFFSESQFESYRALGQHVAEIVFTEARDDAADADGSRRLLCRTLFATLARRWFAMPPEYETSFLKTTEDYVALQKSMAEDADLHPITLSMYPELKAALKDDTSKPSTTDAGKACVELHTMLRMLQILENAWLSLNLDVHHAHPLNRGWMDVFYRWTNTDVYRKHWPVIRAEFSRRFINFCERQMRLGETKVEAVRKAADVTIPSVLADQFNEQWPKREASPDHPKRDSLEERARSAEGVWFVHAGFPAIETPLGIIILRRVEDPKSVEPVHDFLVWVRGAHRNIGLGRKAVEQILSELKKEWKGPHRLRVTLPLDELSGPGAKFVKAMWLTFFNRFNFHPIPQPARPDITPVGLTREAEIILELTITGSADR